MVEASRSGIAILFLQLQEVRGKLSRVLSHCCVRLPHLVEDKVLEGHLRCHAAFSLCSLCRSSRPGEEALPYPDDGVRVVLHRVPHIRAIRADQTTTTPGLLVPPGPMESEVQTRDDDRLVRRTVRANRGKGTITEMSSKARSYSHHQHVPRRALVRIEDISSVAPLHAHARGANAYRRWEPLRVADGVRDEGARDVRQGGVGVDTMGNNVAAHREGGRVPLHRVPCPGEPAHAIRDVHWLRALMVASCT